MERDHLQDLDSDGSKNMGTGLEELKCKGVYWI
jgi:hypothetical protein